VTCGRDDPPGLTCSECGHHFAALRTFVWHQKGETCATPEEMTAKGYSLDSRGVWRRSLDWFRVATGRERHR